MTLRRTHHNIIVHLGRISRNIDANTQRVQVAWAQSNSLISPQARRSQQED